MLSTLSFLKCDEAASSSNSPELSRFCLLGTVENPEFMHLKRKKENISFISNFKKNQKEKNIKVNLLIAFPRIT